MTVGNKNLGPHDKQAEVLTFAKLTETVGD